MRTSWRKLPKPAVIFTLLAFLLLLLPPSMGDSLRLRFGAPFPGVLGETGASASERASLAYRLLLAEDRLAAVELEARDLREALAGVSAFRRFRPRVPAEAVLPVRVLSQEDVSGQAATLVVDGGSADGVREGNVLMVGESLAGEVAECGAERSLVYHLSDPRVRLRVVLDRSGVEAVACGQGGGRMLLKHLQEGSDVRPGDRVISSGLRDDSPARGRGLGTRFPGGLPLGEVVSVGGASWEPGLEVEVRPYVPQEQVKGAVIVTLPPAHGLWKAGDHEGR